MLLLDYARVTELGLVCSGRPQDTVGSEVESIAVGEERRVPPGTALLCNSEAPAK